MLSLLTNSLISHYSQDLMLTTPILSHVFVYKTIDNIVNNCICTTTIQPDIMPYITTLTTEQHIHRHHMPSQ